MALKWTEHKPPINDVCFYDHVTCDTPLGECWITWKSWKKHADFDVVIDDKIIGTAFTLDEAKAMAERHIRIKAEEILRDFGSSCGA